MTEQPPTSEELQELLNGEDFYELLRKTPDPEAKAYIDKVWMDAIYGKFGEEVMTEKEKTQSYKKLVPEVREKTGAGYMDCMKGLAMCEGNIEKAVEWVKEHHSFCKFYG